MRLIVLAMVLGVSSCTCKKNEPTPLPPPPVTPGQIEIDGAYHSIACGAVTAVWSGNGEPLKDLPQPVRKALGVESLAFRFADGSSKGFVTQGQVFNEDWRFDIFSPDCAWVALQMDHYGPYHVVKTADLRGYLEGRVKPLVIEGKHETTAVVHEDLRWRDATHFDFFASCCGGATAWLGDVGDGSVKQVFEAAEAPRGLERVRDGYRVR